MSALRSIAVALVVMLMTSPVWALGYSWFEIDEGGVISTIENFEEYGEHTGVYTYPGGASNLRLTYLGGTLDLSVGGVISSISRQVDVNNGTIIIVYQGTFSDGRAVDVTATYTPSTDTWDMEGTVGGTPVTVRQTKKVKKKGGIKRSFTMVWEGNVLTYHSKPNEGRGFCSGALLEDSQEVASIRCESWGTYKNLLLTNPDHILAWIFQFYVQ